MVVNTKINKDILYIYLDGELDQSVAEHLRKQVDEYLDKVQPKNVVWNFKNLRFMDSTGVGFIMGRYKKLKEKNVTMFFNEPSKPVDKILKVSGLYTIIPLI